jgi:predicted nucleic acid-binding protein
MAGYLVHLDTNILIDLISLDCPYPSVGMVQNWLSYGEELAISAVAWSEVCNGNITGEQKRGLEQIVEGRVLDFTKAEAEVASRLYHATGRRRGSHADCMIAAAAMSRGHDIATRNVADFERFRPHGLKLRAIA